jgi:hypothetical protein
MSCEVRDLLAGGGVVEGDDACVTGGCEEFGCWREGYGADGFDEGGKAVEEACGSVGEEVDGAGLVAGGCQGAVW